MAIESLKGFRWRRLSDTHWEFVCPRQGAKALANVSYDDIEAEAMVLVFCDTE